MEQLTTTPPMNLSYISVHAYTTAHACKPMHVSFTSTSNLSQWSTTSYSSAAGMYSSTIVVHVGGADDNIIIVAMYIYNM